MKSAFDVVASILDSIVDPPGEAVPIRTDCNASAFDGVDASGGKGTEVFVKFTGTIDANDGVTEADGVIERFS